MPLHLGCIKLFGTDIPRKQFEVNYDTLEGLTRSDETLPHLLGLVEANNANLAHPYVLTQVGQQLGYPSWHGARKLVERIQADKGVNIVETDNRYHCAVKGGAKTIFHKYSKEAVALLKKVKDGEPYVVSI